ncbi:hypothetical protein [Luteolibacter sp. AS25]|uniref:hypothetical protein n=1 Tax=Luteolibacter sp. AS25 TaxID=3135776 RepID=UPI00398A9747
MKFTFPILAIVVCLGAAYFSWTESEKFKQVQSERLEAIKTNKVVSANADAADVKIKAEREVLAKAKDNLAVLEQTVAALESDATSFKNELKKLDARLASQNAEFAQLDETMKEVEAVFAGLGEDVNIDNLGEKIEQIEADIDAKTAKVDELDELLKGADSNLASKRKDVSRLVDRKTARNKRISGNALVARVTAVNQEWGFLVIGAGKNSGFTPQTGLLVERNGRMIGRVSPSSIEPTQTIADIELESLAPGVRIQSGDTVILEKPAAN